MRHFKSAVLISLAVAAAMLVYNWVSQDSVLQSIVLYPLFPGLIAGLFFSGHGGNTPVAIVSCWVVDSAIYWVLWQIVCFAMQKIGVGSAPSGRI
jgi:hypothetical protein